MNQGRFNLFYYQDQIQNKFTNPATLPKLALMQNDTNAGFAGGNNIAFKLLTGQDAYFWLSNPDMTIQENTLDELVKFAVQQSSRAIIGGVFGPLQATILRFLLWGYDNLYEIPFSGMVTNFKEKSYF